MPRIRSIKPELWLSPQVMNLTHSARLMFLGLITQADDEGRGAADLRRLKAAIFPGDDCRLDDVEAWLSEVAAERLAVLYQDSAGTRLYQLTGWLKNQRVPKPTPSNYESPTGTLPELSGSTIGGSERKEGKGRDQGATERAESVPDVPGLDPVAWRRWVNYRAETKRKLLPASYDAAARQLAKFGAQQAAVVEQSIAAGWQGLFELKAVNGNGRAQPVVPAKRERPPTADEIAEARRKAAAENAAQVARLGLGGTLKSIPQ